MGGAPAAAEPGESAAVAALLHRTEVGARSGFRPALAADLRVLAAGGPVTHRIVLPHHPAVPVLPAMLTGLFAGGGEAVRHVLLAEAPEQPSALPDAHAVIVTVGYGPLFEAWLKPGPPPAGLVRPGRALALAASLLPPERIAVLVAGADRRGFAGRRNLDRWAAVAVRRVFGPFPGGEPLVVAVQPEAAARAWREAGEAPGDGPLWRSSGAADLAERLVGPWTASAPADVARISAQRYTAAVRSARQAVADLRPRYGWPDDAEERAAPRTGGPHSRGYAKELRDLLISATCGPLLDLVDTPSDSHHKRETL
ncbi:hypothetical protein ACIQGZ_10865 [Streptomyces sp. NPDC092296]|uniref:hypothetical protein n=1 Tax=Streptomyces sp. NPDC092296 TaxID=3366012 RepID=UPI00381F9411